MDHIFPLTVKSIKSSLIQRKPGSTTTLLSPLANCVSFDLSSITGKLGAGEEQRALIRITEIERGRGILLRATTAEEIINRQKESIQ